MKRLSPAQVGWIFLFSYVTGVILTASTSWQDQHNNVIVGLFVLYVLIGQIGLNMLPGVIWCRWRGLSLKQVFRLRAVPWPVLGLAVLVYVVSQVPILFLHQLTEASLVALGDKYQVSIYPVANNLYMLLLLAVCIGIIPPICEEMLFRGILLTGFEQRGALFAAAVSSALFALFHDNPYRLLELFAAALVSALIVQYADSIVPGLAVHLATNLTYVAGSYARGGDLMKGVSQGEASINWLLLLLVGLVSIPAVYVCWLLLRRIKRMTKFELARGAQQLECQPCKPIRIPKNARSDMRITRSLSQSWAVPLGMAVIVFIVKTLIG